MKDRTCKIDGHSVEIISIEDILQKINKSTANLTEEQKIIMKIKLLQYEYDKLTDVLNCLPKIQNRLNKLRDEIFKEIKRAEHNAKR